MTVETGTFTKDFKEDADAAKRDALRRENIKHLQKDADTSISLIEHITMSIEQRTFDPRFIDWKAVRSHLDVLRKTIDRLADQP